MVEQLVRMFFKSGQVDLRPVRWVHFVQSSKFDFDALPDALKKRMERGEEVFVAFVDQMNGMQIFRGDYVDANKRGKPGRSSGRAGQRS